VSLDREPAIPAPARHEVVDRVLQRQQRLDPAVDAGRGKRDQRGVAQELHDLSPGRGHRGPDVLVVGVDGIGELDVVGALALGREACEVGERDQQRHFGADVGQGDSPRPVI